MDINDSITPAAGVAEGFISAGASTTSLLFAGTAVIPAGGSAAAGARYSEERTEWEMNRVLLEAERASIEADPAGEFDELVDIYRAKGLSLQLARLLAATLRRPGERPAPRAAHPGPRTPGVPGHPRESRQPTEIGGLAPGAAPPDNDLPRRIRHLSRGRRREQAGPPPGDALPVV